MKWRQDAADVHVRQTVMSKYDSLSHVTFKALTAASVKIKVCLDVTPYSLVNGRHSEPASALFRLENSFFFLQIAKKQWMFYY